MPCAPGGSPVPRLVRLTAVVDGTPAVRLRPVGTSDDRYGATSACRRSRFHPSPSRSSTAYLGAGGSPSVFCSCGTDSAPATDGSTSVSDPPPYCGATGANTALPAGRERQRLREVEHLLDAGRAVRCRADPQRDVVGRDGSGVAVVGLAVRVGADGRLEVDPVHHAPADGQDDLTCSRHRRVGLAGRVP